MRILTFIIFLCSTIYNISCFNYKGGLLWKAEEVDFISTQCQESIKLFKENLCTNGQDDIWALQMLDASSKIPIGILSYNFGELGNFNQCLKIKSKNYVIMGKYCLGNIAVNTSAIDEDSIYIKSHMYMKTVLTKITVGIKLNGNPTMAICIPSNCTDDDAKKLMSSPELGVSVQSVICQTIENVYPELTKEAIVAISVLSTLILIVILSTACDLLYSNKIENLHPILLAFSLYANGKKLFKIPRRSSNLSSLDGLRVMSMVWIVMLHSHSVYTSGPVSNAKDIVNFTNSFMSMIFINGDLACDTFLIIGGTLITFVYFKRQNIHKGNYKMSVSVVLKHYLHRYLRLTPPLAGVVFVSATLLRYMGSGPKWPYIVNNFEENCKVYWWSALLYIQNIFNVDRMCVGHSWYLNVDMQLYFFSPLILWLLKERTKTGIGILIFTSLLSMSVSFIRGYVEELSGVRSTYYSKSSSDVYMNTYYLKTETRATPWLMGIILGYILSGKKYTEIRLSKMSVMIYQFQMAYRCGPIHICLILCQLIVILIINSTLTTLY
ncbi:unnamed protein product [Psylliodes chrysocephalus]|uniref:Nose resistant-to-fluoxetine protein N-terminal domain-containing protein n=1 Tax=Psylliodes chrysocephalus TaxID=3402493 RepID=A0A9P0G6U8_9CUCU|nr:unnamed protein product [Psylliodes chrysocephala]